MLAIVLVAFSGMVFAESGKPKYGGTLKIIVYAEGLSMGYTVEQLAPEDWYQRTPAFEPLVRYDQEKQQPVPFLAESVQQDPEAMTITFKVRKGIKFHDGTTLDAEAVKWNFEQLRESPGLGASWLGASSIEATDDYTVVVHFHSWDNTFLRNMCWDSCMMSPTAFKEKGLEWVRDNAVGTGPFKQVSFQRDVKKVYERFDGYWQKGKPYLDRIEMTVIADPTVGLASFLRQEHDLITNLSCKNAKALEGKPDIVISKEEVWGSLWMLVGDSVNPDSPFANLKVRQAMSYAIDRKAIVDSMLYGYAEPAQQLSRSNAWSYNPDMEGYPYNPEKAKALLKEAGYPDGFTTTLWTRSDDLIVKMFTAVQAYLADVGIKANLEVLHPGKYAEIYIGTGWRDGMLAANSPIYPEIGIQTRYYFEAGSPLGIAKTVMHPEDLEKLLKQFTRASDFETQKKLGWKAQSGLIQKYCIATPVVILDDIAAKYSWVKSESPYTTGAALGVTTFADAWIDK
jgi:ABC-type transport system substrate-binding protein